MSNDRSSIAGPGEYPVLEPTEALAEDPDATTPPDQISLPNPQEARDVEREVESPTPPARLNTQNLEKPQEEIGSALEDFPFPHPENPEKRQFQARQYLMFDENDFLGSSRHDWMRFVKFCWWKGSRSSTKMDKIKCSSWFANVLYNCSRPAPLKPPRL